MTFASTNIDQHRLHFLLEVDWQINEIKSSTVMLRRMIQAIHLASYATSQFEKAPLVELTQCGGRTKLCS
jgi:hypothetical protein